MQTETQTLSGSSMASADVTVYEPTGSSTSLVRISDIICSASFAGLIGLSVALISGVESRTASVLLADISGLLFLIAAAVYRGSVRTWWLWFAPISFALLIVPVAVAEAKGVVEGAGDILRAALIPGLAYLGGNLVATFRDTLRRSGEVADMLDDLQGRLLDYASDLKRLGGEMTDIIDWAAQTETPKEPSQLKWRTVEYNLDPHMFETGEERIGRFDHADLQAVLNSEMDRVTAEAAHRPKIKLTLVHPREIPVPLAVRGSVEILRSVLRGLLTQALDSLVGDEGVIRVSVRPGMSNVSISIEDNGRGLNEAFILKLQEKGVLSRSNGRWDIKSIRRAAEASGWRFEMLARLGVGARVILEMPRVDAFAYGVRVRSRLEGGSLLVPEVETRGS